MLKKCTIFTILTLSVSLCAFANDAAVFESLDSVESQPPTVQGAVNAAPVENKGFQNAINGLDTARVEISNQLVNYRTKYTEVDSQYKLISEERKMLKKQVKETEKRIKKLDKTKEDIRRSITQ